MAKRGRKEKDNWKKKRRQEYLEKKEFRYYIFCEGQATEPKYFQGFKRYIEDNPIYRDMVLIEIEGCQAETMRVIGKAEEYVRENKITKGQIWCVYDKDSFPSSDVNGVVQRAEVLNQKNPDIQYHAAWSNECIEFWFMLHFAYYTANNHRSEYKKFLNEKFQELGIGKYEKNMDDIFETLMNGGNPKLAIRYARRIIKNGEGKTPEQIFRIAEAMKEKGQKAVLITRMNKESAIYVGERLELQYDEVSRIGFIGEAPIKDGDGKIVVATGGTSDIPVAEEAARTAETLGNEVIRLYDVGVAGVHRLLGHLGELMEARVIIAVAGMEGALASVIGGLVDCPVIAVPTSVGYGASFGGVSALLSMLNSCASGVSVVNIDNGFGAGFLASRINHIERRTKE